MNILILVLLILLAYGFLKKILILVFCKLVNSDLEKSTAALIADNERLTKLIAEHNSK